MTQPSNHNVETLYVIYDAQCLLCTGTVRKLQQMRFKAEIVYVSIQSLIEGKSDGVPVGNLPGIESLYDKLHIVDGSGRIFAGADGIVRMMRTMPGLSWMAWIYRIPGAKGIADAVYQYTANRRYEWFGKADEGCSSGACRLPDSKERQGGRESG